MVFSGARHRRRSIRLPGYDYARPGAYFVTVCTEERARLFGAVIDGEIHLNETGQIVRAEWMRSAEIRREISLDEFVVMPNHVHGIIFIHAGEGTDATAVMAAGAGATGRPPRQAAPHWSTTRPGPPPRSLGSFIGGFKSAATMRINALRGLPGMTVWQRNYYEHVIRDDSELQRIRLYIRQNPLQWAIDRENPEATAHDPLQPWEPQAR
jgi:putative transposase